MYGLRACMHSPKHQDVYYTYINIFTINSQQPNLNPPWRMHIKKIVIQGFKTYKNTTIIDDLSPSLNVVVGRNGSGKSNFFAAIRFVLSDAYTHMTREERQGLIHEGSGTVMSAYVEIVFDNTDRRFPLQKDEVSIRRTIGLKKDDYSMDGKSATRSDVMNLLESAGFSRLNPYYIVPQGKITSLTNSKDSERLALLKEVSGAKVFEAKLKESTKEMTNSSFKMERIDEAMEKLSEKLSDLQIESNDLQEFQQLEKDKKVYEFNLFDRELNSLTSQIGTSEDEYSSIMASSHKDIQDLEKREASCQTLQTEIDELTSTLKVASLEREQSEIDKTKVASNLVEKETLEHELKLTLQTANVDAEQQSVKKDSLSKSLHEKQNKLANELEPQFLRLSSEETRLKSKISELTTRQRLLYAKQSRFLKFTSKKQRDKWLKDEMKAVNKDLQATAQQLSLANESKSKLQEELSNCEARLEEIRTSLDGEDQHAKIQKYEEDIESAKRLVASLSEERKSLWREEIRYRSLYDSSELELSNANHKVSQTMDQELARGIQAVREIAERLGLEDSVYGPLAELFTVSDKYKTAVEVVAGNSLFHVVVDTDETALVLMKELARVRGGRVTFMPLNRLHVPPVTFPDQEENEYIPLIKKIKHSEEVTRAVQQVFGRTIVCKDLHHGSDLARLHNLNAITLDGDRASTKGVLTGGFRNFKNSRLDALKLQSRKKRELAKLADELQQCSLKLQGTNEQLTQSNNELDSKLSELEKYRASLEPLNAEHSRLLSTKFNLKKNLSEVESTVEVLEGKISNLKLRFAQHEEEIQNDFTQALSEAELEELNSLTSELSNLEDDLNTIVTSSASLEIEIASVQAECANLEAQIRSIDFEGDVSFAKNQDVEYQLVQSDIKSLKVKLKKLEKRFEEHSRSEQKLSGKLAKARADLKKANELQEKTVARLESVGKKAEKILSKKAILDSRREEVQEKISDLGVLPEEAFQQSKFESVTLDNLLVELNSVNTNLKRFAHINRKAMEQYSAFTKEREDLIARKDELERSKESIESLMVSLEHQKDSAIKRSFKEVSKSFAEVFEKLVPNGVGQLVMKAKENADGDAESIDNYVGVSIQVSFNSKHDEQQKIEQLSGGQKSLCAIALILAIQKCDPAPFYLFDEIDANLDAQYRTAVATMLQLLARNAQFICTTFRPEMLQCANTFYGVLFSNKVSTVLEIEQDEALSFVEGQR